MLVDNEKQIRNLRLKKYYIVVCIVHLYEIYAQ